MFRIKETPKGWIVEVQVNKWTLFGNKKVWKPFVKTSGMDSAWHHSKMNFAFMNFEEEIKKQTEIIKL